MNDSTLSLEVLSLVDWLTFNEISLLNVDPVLVDELLVDLVGVVELLKSVILEGLVITPLFGDLCSSPHPNALDIVAAWHTVHSVAGEGVLAEVVEVADESVHKIGCKIVLDSLT